MTSRRIERPVIIVSPPRSGSTLLLQTLCGSPTVYSLGYESHQVIEGIAALHPAQRGWDSNRLTAEDATPEVALELVARFLPKLRWRNGSRELPDRVRMLEKTCTSLLRVPFLRAVFPDAYFIYLHRDACATISSLIEAWGRQRLVPYRELPGWGENPRWVLTLVPGWRALKGRSLEEIAACQWATAMQILLDDLETLDAGSWCVASYDALVAEPRQEIERLCALAGLAWDRPIKTPLPLSHSTETKPHPDKWLRDRDAIERVADRFQSVAERAASMAMRRRNTSGPLTIAEVRPNVKP